MKAFKIKNLIVTSVFFVLLLLALIFAFIKAPEEEIVDVGAPTEGNTIGFVLSDKIFEQTFTAQNDGLCRIDIKLATYARTNNSNVILQVFNGEKEILMSTTVPASELKDNSFYALNFTPIPHSKGKAFSFTLTSDTEDAENAITSLASFNNTYEDGILYVNGDPTEIDIAFNTYYNSRACSKKLFAFAVVLIFIAMISAIVYNVFSKICKPVMKLVLWLLSSIGIVFAALSIYNRFRAYYYISILFDTPSLIKAAALLPLAMMISCFAFNDLHSLPNKQFVKQHFGETLKQLAPAYIVTFVFEFMLFIYEPILIYSTNKNDYRFDLATMMPPLLLFFAVCLAIGFSVVTIIYLINKMFSDNLIVYYCALIGFFIIFFACYLQGNWLAGDLPVLSGDIIQWDSFLKNDLISIAIWVMLIVAAICLTVKFTPQKVVKATSAISAALFLMLSAGMISTMISENAFMGKGEVFVATMRNFNTVSTDKNFFIFIVDTVDSKTFKEVLDSNEDYKKTFEDFTYYENIVSLYGNTLNAIPHILTGKVNHNEEEIWSHCQKAYNESEFFKNLNAYNYDINLYSTDTLLSGERTFDVKNDVSFNLTVNYIEFIKQQMKYVCFKYLPYAYKKYAQIETADFNIAFECNETMYRYANLFILSQYENNPNLVTQSKPIFQFIHTEGAHTPYTSDENLNYIENGTYSQKIAGSIKMINLFIQRLKNNGIYDNSVIIVLADHGAPTNGIYEKEFDCWMRRFNPIFLIKGFDEHHELIVDSDLPVSYELDLQDAYKELLDGKKSTELFLDVPEQRNRKVLWSIWTKQTHMVEYETDDKAWEWDKYRATGNVYDLVS